jgi:hypothetical protein
MLDRLVAKIGLDRSGIDAVVGQLEAAGVAQHMRVDFHLEASRLICLDLKRAASIEALLFPERPVQLVVQRLDQIGKHGASAGLNEGFHRHARRQLHLAELCDLLTRHRDTNEIVALTRALVGRGVGTDPNQSAADLGRRSHVEGGEAKHDRLPELDLVNILRLNLGFDHQRVGFGHDQHHRITSRDHAADGVCGRLKDDAILRCAQVSSLELIFRGHLALDIFADFAVGIAQLLGDVAGEFLIDLQFL